MNHDVIGLIPAAGKGVRLGLPYPKELYPIIRPGQSAGQMKTGSPCPGCLRGQ